MTFFAEVGYYEPWWIQLLKALVIFAVVFQLVPVVLLAERKILGRFQHRYGPNRVGPFGVLQPMADIGKLLFKEQFRPSGSIGWMFALAPAISMFTAVATAVSIEIAGAIAKIQPIDVRGRNCALNSSFPMSAIGCRIPNGPTRLGP